MGRAPVADAILEAERAARRQLLALQEDAGFWEGEVVWCPVLLAQWILARHAMGRPLSREQRDAAVVHFRATQASEGGWGLHRESPPYLFVTVLSYAALRILGVSATQPPAAAAGRWIATVPGRAAAIPAWGKFWLALLGLFPYERVPPIPPEALLLPRRFPFHPGRLYCHTRLIYTGMAFLYGSRVRFSLGPVAEELGRELFEPGFDAVRSEVPVASSDLFAPPGAALRGLVAAQRLFERIAPRRLRARALDRAFEEILYEQRATGFEGISPVSAMLNTLAIFARDARHPDLEASVEGLERWRWSDSEGGLRFAGARSQTWDTAFALRALLAGEGALPVEAIARAHAWLCGAQILEELPGRALHGRDAVAGGWCFSDGAHRWPVADCTAEALCAILEAEGRSDVAKALRPLVPSRVDLAAGFLLDRQNSDGGFGTYERRRAGEWLERWNPSEMFDGCMTDRSHVECTASCVAALARIRVRHPSIRPEEIGRALDSGVAFLRRAQAADGSFPAAWGIQETYSAFFAVEALRAARVPSEDPTLLLAAQRILALQKKDGGWGEHYRGLLEGRSVEHPRSQVEMTSWALLALLPVLGSRHDAVRRGAEWLAARQLPDSSFPGDAVNGVFFRTAMLDYTLYRSHFPAWALGRYRAGLHGRPPGEAAGES